MQFFTKVWEQLVQFGFRLLYHELAFTYDVVSNIVSLGAWHCWQRTALLYLPAPSNDWVLELAHGTGHLQIALKKAGYRTVGYDLSHQMGRIAKKKLQGAGVSPLLVRGRAEQLPFADDQFAAVIATFPTEFIVADETLKEAHRVLVDDGQLVIVLSAELVSGGLVRIFLEWLYRITGQRQLEQNGAIKDELLDLFGSHGFEMRFVQEPCSRSVVHLIVAQKKV
jgi:ubiquinone/menaquinone biosynthesis C-methylase UbiE